MGKRNICNISNANVYIGGVNHIGKADDVKVSGNYKFVTKKPLGMIGPQEFFAGLEKIEAEIKWNSFYSDVYKQVANPQVPVEMQFRSNVEKYTGDELTEQVPLIYYLRAKANNFPEFGQKQQEQHEASTKFTVTYVRIVENGQNLLEIDLESELFVVNGVDVFKQYRKNIGA
ncbi:MAG TPA: phage major tail tube protein [bacterium]|nr:phage major tail tube protein [bacterium]